MNSFRIQEGGDQEWYGVGSRTVLVRGGSRMRQRG